MQSIVDRLYEDCPLYLTREEHAKALSKLTIEEFGAGCFLINGPEIHFAKFDASPLTPRHVRRVQQLVREYGYATTRVPKEDTRIQRFAERIGFRQVGEDQYDMHYRIEAFRGKETTCRN